MPVGEPAHWRELQSASEETTMLRRGLVMLLCAACMTAVVAGCSSTSGPEDQPADVESPHVALSHPPSNAVIGDNVTFVAEATDSRFVATVEFVINGVVTYLDAEYPFEFTWDASGEDVGSVHSVYARATDGAGNQSESPVVVVHCRWRRLISDDNEFGGVNIARLFVRSTATMIEFRMVTYESWQDVHDPENGLDVGIMLDVDQNQSTGLNEFVPGWAPPNDIGADFGAGVGYEGDRLWEWDAADTLWEPAAEYVQSSIPDSGSRFEVGIALSDIGDPSVIDVVVISSLDHWDWAPDSGHATYHVDGLYLGGGPAGRWSTRSDVVSAGVRGPLWGRDRARRTSE